MPPDAEGRPHATGAARQPEADTDPATTHRSMSPLSVPGTGSNRTLAARARDLAAAAPPGSLDRKAAGCVAVALHESPTASGAARVLVEVRPADVRDAAGELLAELVDGGE